MRNQRRAHVARAEHQIEHAFRHARVDEDLHERRRSRRSFLARLPDQRVARDQRGEDIPAWHGDREIPGRDQPDHADRVAQRHAELVRHFDRRGIAVHPPPFAAHEERHVDGFLHVAARFGEDLAHLLRHQAGELLLCALAAAPPPDTALRRAAARARAATPCRLALAALTAASTSLAPAFATGAINSSVAGL